MAIPFLNVRCQQRSKGANAISKAAYNSCSCMEVDGDQVDYTRKAGLVFSELMLADGQSEQTRQEFWQSVEESEKRINSTVSREIIAALPLELDQAQRQQLARNFALQIRKQFDLPAVDLNIHEPVKRKREAKADENPHLHLQFPDRNAAGKKIREFSSPKTIQAIRHLWERHCNYALKQAGLEIQISMKPLETQIKQLEAEIRKDKRQIRYREEKIFNLELELYAQTHVKPRSMEGQAEARPQPFAGHSGGTGKTDAENGGKPQEFEGSRNRGSRLDIQDAERNNRRREAGEKSGAGGINRTPGRAGSKSDGSGEQLSLIRQLMEKIRLQLEAWKEKIDLETIRSKSHDNRNDDRESHDNRQKTLAPHP